MASQHTPDGATPGDNSAADAASRLYKRLRRQEKYAASVALRKDQAYKTEMISEQLPRLRGLLDACSLPGPGTIDLPARRQDEESVTLGEGASATVEPVSVRIPGERRIKNAQLALKLFTCEDSSVSIAYLDKEVTYVITLHERLKRARQTSTCLKLCPEAIPLQPPVPEVLALCAVPDMNARNAQDGRQPVGFCMEKYDCCLEDMLQHGRIAQDDFFRVVQAVATALALVHRGGLKRGQQRNADGRHVGGLHLDVKSSNILVKCGSGGRLALPIHKARAAARAKAPPHAIVLADFGLAVASAGKPHYHTSEITTLGYRSPAVALSDLACEGENVLGLVPRSTPMPPVGENLALGTEVDTYSLGVVCWDMLRGAVYHPDTVPWLRLIARGVAQASGDLDELPTHDERPAFAFAKLLTGGWVLEERELLNLVIDTFGESVLLRWSLREAGAGQQEEEPSHGRAWRAQLMPKAYLFTLASASRRLASHACESDRVIADAAYCMPGEALVHSAVGILQTGGAVPSPEEPLGPELPTGVAEKVCWICRFLSRPRLPARARRGKLLAAGAAGRRVFAILVAPIMRAVAAVMVVCTAREDDQPMPSLSTCKEMSAEDTASQSTDATSADSVNDCDGSELSLKLMLNNFDAGYTASQSSSATLVESVSYRGGDVGQVKEQKPSCDLNYTAQAVLLGPGAKYLFSPVDTAQGCGEAERLAAADLRQLLSDSAGANMVVPDRSPPDTAKAVLASKAAADQGTVADEVIQLGARCQGSSRVLPMGAADFGTADGTAEELGAEGRAPWVSVSDDAKRLVHVATDSESSRLAAAERSARHSNGSSDEADEVAQAGLDVEVAAMETQVAAEVASDVVSKANAEAERDSKADAETEEPPERVTFRGYIRGEDSPKEGEPEAEAAERASGGSCMWLSSCEDDSGRLIGSCPGEAPSCSGEAVDAATRPSRSTCCFSERKLSMPEEQGKEQDEEEDQEQLMDVLAEEVAQLHGTKDPMRRLKRALCLGVVRTQHEHTEAPMEALEHAAKGLRAKKGGIARLLDRIIGCRGLRVQE